MVLLVADTKNAFLQIILLAKEAGNKHYKAKTHKVNFENGWFI